MNIDYIFRYLKAEQISINEKEFRFQVQSNPEHASLVSIVDALTFFGIESVAFKHSFSELALLPVYFVAILRVPDGKIRIPFLVEKKEHHFIVYGEEKEQLTLTELENRWCNIVMLVRKPTTTFVKARTPKRQWTLILGGVLLLLFLFSIIYNKIIWWQAAFFLLPLIGCFFSIFYLKELFQIDNRLVSKICEESKSTSCKDDTEINTFVQISDFGMIYFPFQLISLLFAYATQQVYELLSIYKVLSIAIPIIVLASLYFQKFVRKKWCPLCLLISATLLLQFGVLYSVSFPFIISVAVIFQALTTLLLVALFWIVLRKNLSIINQTHTELIESNRIVRNYELFKNILIRQRSLKVTPHAFSNHSSTIPKVVITAIISPMCNPCKATFKNLFALYQQYHDILQVNIVIKTNIELNDKALNTFYKNLEVIYNDEGFLAFMEALNDWFQTQDLTLCNAQNHREGSFEKAEERLNALNDWCVLQGYSFTPVLFIQNYQLPHMYESHHITHFMENIKEDDSFNLTH